MKHGRQTFHLKPTSQPFDMHIHTTYIAAKVKCALLLSIWSRYKEETDFAKIDDASVNDCSIKSEYYQKL